MIHVVPTYIHIHYAYLLKRREKNRQVNNVTVKKRPSYKLILVI